jgi:phosphonatase-like hydrolase
MTSIKLVIFDIAGTIIEDHGEVVTAFAAALAKNGVRADKDELKAWKGASKREVIRHFVEQHGSKGNMEEQVETTYRSFREELERAYSERLIPIDGAEGTFAWCREHHIQMATTTGFYREVSEMILRNLGWESLFSANVSSSDVSHGRPAPFMIFRAMEMTNARDVRQVINVGDTPLDLQSGTNAGVRGVVGVLTGAHDRESLSREPHTHILASVAGIPELIERAF